MKSLNLATLFALVIGLRAAPAPGLQDRDLDISSFIEAVEDIFPDIDAGIADVCGVITDGENVLADEFSISTSSDVSGCSDVTLIFARGTCDPGNVGVLVGPPFIDALQSALGSRSLGVQGVDYPASVDGYLSDDPSGGETMSGLISSIQSSCPDTQMVLGGYSQGGYVVHNAASDVGSDAMSKVSAVVIFGDPDSHEAVDGIDSSRVMIVCHVGDDICDQGDIIFIQHLTYAEDAASAASFVVSQL